MVAFAGSGAIGRAVAQDGVGLIAIATHGRSGLTRLLVGSVAAGVLRGASVPVLLSRAADRNW